MKHEGRGLHRKEGERLKSISRRASSCGETEKKPEDRPERGDTKGGITREEFLNDFQTDSSLEPGGCWGCACARVCVCGSDTVSQTSEENLR